MTTVLDEKVNRRYAEVLSKACCLVDEWISKTDDMSAVERRHVDAYLQAKIEFLVILDTVLPLVVESEKNKDSKAVA